VGQGANNSQRKISSTVTFVVSEANECKPSLILERSLGLELVDLGGKPVYSEICMKSICNIAAATLMFGAIAVAQGQQWHPHTRIVTASNAATNELLVYNSFDKLIQVVATGGKGGASGNAGGIATYKDLVAVVNFGSKTVSIFEHSGDRFVLKHTIPTASSPLSVAFGHDHLYILGATTVESHQVSEGWVSSISDGEAALLHADGTAAQVGVVDHELIITEKSNVIESVPLGWDSGIAGVANLVSDIPANVNAPFGLVTRGNEAYVTIAHANEISLVRHDAVLSVTGSATQNAPCWLALDGPFLFSSNSPSQSVSRYAVYGKNIVQDAAVVANFVGDPTDIAYYHELAAVIDGANGISRISIFHVDEDGDFTLEGVSTIKSAANGVAIIQGDE
jgi:hypothetical protein